MEEDPDSVSDDSHSQPSERQMSPRKAVSNDLEIIDLEADETISSTSPNANEESEEPEEEDDESVTSFPPPPTSNKSEVIVVGADTTIVNEQDEFEDEVCEFGSK